MKKILILTMGALLLAGVAACGKKTTKKNEVNGKGVLKESIISKRVLSSSDTIVSNKIETVINKYGNIESEYTYLLKNDEWILRKKIENEYDKDNNIISSEELRVKENTTTEFEKYSKTEYAYLDGVLKTKTEYIVKEGETEYFKRNDYEYTYDAKGNLLMAVKTYTPEFKAYQSYNNSDHKVVYTYDDNNNQLTERNYVIFSSDWEPTTNNERIYNDSNKKVTEIGYDSDSQVSYKIEYEYDEKGNEKTSVLYRPNDELELEISQKYEKKYDKDNHIIQSAEYYHNNEGEFVERSEEVFTYDDKGNLITDDYYIYHNGSKIKSQAIKNTYTDLK
ncbi:MAG: hypothetical protein K6E24_05255 [bacterium]|nr:hypothetical protein [bacterium]